ncbi:MAG: glycosyltransferase family 39 protein [Planctomycetota bacterium]|jgi:4-amino-4-deoxy-L-arabinose transferase-like glycosyltransferase|nr:glycosyltransferase family 39 protein [Planctomycetota bacterium]
MFRQKIIWLILLLALAARAGAWAFYVEPRLSAEQPLLMPDSAQFVNLSENLSARGEFVLDDNRRAWRTPLYPLLLAALSFAGENFAVYRLLGIALDLLNVYLIYRLATQIFSRRAGYAAAAVAAIYPAFVFMSPLILSDTISHTVILLAVFLLLKLTRENYAWRVAAGLGWVLAAATLVKPSLGLLIAPLALYALLAAPRPRRRSAFIAAGALGLFFVLGMGGWWCRNYQVFQRFVPLATMGGFTLWESSGAGADGGANNGKVAFPPLWQKMTDKLAASPTATLADAVEIEITGGVNLPLPDGGEVYLAGDLPLELAADAYLSAAAWHLLRADPQRALRLSARKFWRTWSPLPHWENARAFALPLAALYGGVALSALYSACFRRRREILLLLIPVLYLALVHLVYMGSLRYRLPAEGCLLILAAGAYFPREPRERQE